MMSYGWESNSCSNSFLFSLFHLHPWYPCFVCLAFSMNKIILIIWDFNKEETLMTNKRFFFILSLIHFYNNQHIDGKTMKLRHWSVNIWHIIKASMTTSVLRCKIGNSCLQMAKTNLIFSYVNHKCNEQNIDNVLTSYMSHKQTTHKQIGEKQK
jgi:hypothetical protein